MRFLVAKHLGSLRPVDQAGEDALRKIGLGEMVEIELRRPRNIKHHRKYWALVTLVWEQLDHDKWPTAEELHEAIKIRVGLRKRIQLPRGEVGYIAGSIAFHRMSEDEFEAFYGRVCDLIAKAVLPGISTDELKAEVEQLIGVSARAA